MVSKVTMTEAQAFRKWYNINYEGNSLHVSSDEMGAINTTWQPFWDKWRSIVADLDINAYEISDEDLSDALEEGRQLGQKETGEDGNTGGETANATANAIVGAGVGLLGTVVQFGGNLMGNLGTTKFLNMKTMKNDEHAGLNEDKKNANWVVGIPIAVVIAALYWAMNPTKDLHDALKIMKDTLLPSAQDLISEAQGNIGDYREKISELLEEAEGENEDTNDEIKDNKADYDSFKRLYEFLVEKAKSGEPLTKKEQDLLEKLLNEMQELGITIEDLQNKATEIINEIYDEVGFHESLYDEEATKIGEVQGLTDFAASFDETTRILCYMTAIGQTLNAAGAASMAVKASRFAGSGSLLFGATAWAWAWAAMGFGAAVSSGFAAGKEFGKLDDINAEIDLREQTQGLTDNAYSYYEDALVDFDISTDFISKLFLEVPTGDSMEVPDIPDGTSSSQNGDNTDTDTTGGSGSSNPFGTPEDDPYRIRT